MTLEVRGLDVSYGRRQVLFDVNLSLEAGECVAVVGANGAGKTTLARTLAGIGGHARGSARLDGRELLGLSGDAIVRAGLALVPERGGAFGRLSVWENLQLSIEFASRDATEAKRTLDYCLKLFPILEQRQGQKAATLSGGERRMLLVSRALLADPRVIVMDEPSLGLSPLLTEHVINDVVPRLRDRGIAVLLIEQNARLALSVADRGLVLERGRIVSEGRSGELLDSDVMRASYLGL